MNSRQRNKKFLVRGNANKKIIFSVAAIIFFIAFFSFSFTRNMLFGIGAPLWNVRNSIGYFFSDSTGFLNSKGNLLKENDLLKKQIEADKKNQVLFSLLQKENENLKNILNRNTTNRPFLLSAVLVKPFLSAYDTLIIDTGSSNGVKVGDQVLADGDTFIGRISEVYDHTSKVVLYSSPGEKINVLIGNNNVEKEAIGLGGGNFKVEIPKEIDVKEGDSIVIPSISANVFGVVEKIESKESDSFENVLFKNPANMDELKWVEVLFANKS